MTISPYPSHSAPSLEPKGFEFVMISSVSLMFQKAKNVENGLIHFTHNYTPVCRIALTKAPL